jgi:hypothetical protein
MNTFEIKFRGKRVDNNEWIYGSLINRHPLYFILFPVEGASNIGTYKREEVIPATIGQYIGKIRSGEEELFINDLIQHGETIRVIEYRGGNTYARLQNGTATILLSYCENPKKLGNIFDNPELLTQGYKVDERDIWNEKDKIQISITSLQSGYSLTQEDKVFEKPSIESIKTIFDEFFEKNFNLMNCTDVITSISMDVYTKPEKK